MSVSQIGEPKCIEEALKSKEWKEAADSEYQSLMDNGTWNLVKLPDGRKPVGCKWIFKTKCTSEGKIEHYKARLVAKGYTQKPGEDYDQTFSPVARYSCIRALLAFAVQNNDNSPNGCGDSLPKWNIRRRDIHGTTIRLYYGRKREPSF